MEVAGLQKDGGAVQTERFLKGNPVFAYVQRSVLILYALVILSYTNLCTEWHALRDLSVCLQLFHYSLSTEESVSTGHPINKF